VYNSDNKGINYTNRRSAEKVSVQRQSTQGEIKMASMLIQIKVNDFAEWKKGFDAGSGLRSSNGEISHQIYRDATNPNKVATVFQWNSLANAQKFAQSPELKAAMERSGVEGPPTVYFLNES
jgi:heme-degrading monooxygenase HmoA